jgi:DNA-binding GntR family transcriptional regulator
VWRENIEDEDWLINSCIPSENDMSKIYGISRMTVRSENLSTEYTDY